MFFCLLLVDTSKSIHISNTDQYLFIVIFMYHEFNNKLLTLREPVEIDVRPRCHRTAGTAGRGRKEDHQHDWPVNYERKERYAMDSYHSRSFSSVIDVRDWSVTYIR